jgi:hypothetical protein
MVNYFIEFFPNSERKTKVSHSGNSLNIFFEDICKEILSFEFFDELVVPPVGVHSVGKDSAILDILMVGVVGSGDFEFVVVEQAGGCVNVGEGLGLLVADHSDDVGSVC